MSTEPIERPVPLAWPDAVQSTIARVQERAKKTNEPESITNKKIKAIQDHDPTKGDIVVVDVGGERKKMFEGIKIK